MCNRVATPQQDQLQGYFDKQAPSQGRTFKIEPYPHYHNADGFIRPYLPVTAIDSPNEVKPARWKLIPYWVNTEAEAKKYANTLNARSEEVFDKASYKPYILKNRCLLWVSGFFEPNHPAPKVTIPYFIQAKDKNPMALGCIYSDWTDKETGEITRTFTIITTEPNELMKEIHNEGQRMPYIVTPENWNKWLGPLSKEEVISMMKPLPDGYLDGYKVGSIVYQRGVDQNVPESQVPV
jgi:putative SOS response-associated peptidase YedK